MASQSTIYQPAHIGVLTVIKQGKVRLLKRIARLAPAIVGANRKQSRLKQADIIKRRLLQVFIVIRKDKIALPLT